MCTLTYIPLQEGNFVFTTNRDEDPNRKALPPGHHQLNESCNLYPLDQTSNGTWMLCNKNYSVCLLNGAFVKHKHKPPYKKSRGLVVLEYNNYKDTKDFVLNFKFFGIEPFTMIVLRYQKEIQLEEIRWDGNSIHYKNLDTMFPKIWSSSTLYDIEAKAKRVNWFKEWQENAEFSSVNVIEFHKNTGKGDSFNGLIMNRKEMVKTTSITQIVRENKELRMRYEDLKENVVTEKYLIKEKSLI
ncbi:MAG: NRDE family protein [Marinifilum sp.]|jgi:hypothetical protein|nr:NRDE family protein [Marinifilum sp.]